jgi:hypothetical protein
MTGSKVAHRVTIFVGQGIVNADLAIQIVSSLNLDLRLFWDAWMWGFDDLLDYARQRCAWFLLIVWDLVHVIPQ